jgi:D-serine deaminase-like pyridoxal phosphate-dependent protein
MSESLVHSRLDHCRLFEIPASIDTPALVVDRSILERNIERMASDLSAVGVRLRPHFKTSKTLGVVDLCRRHGVSGFAVATIGEAEVLVDHGVTDIFIAYALYVSPAKGARLRALCKQADILIGVDSVTSAERLADELRGLPRLGVMIEVDCGERRAGVIADRVGWLAEQILALGLNVVGAFTHGGHGYDGDVESAASDEVTSMAVAAQGLQVSGVANPMLSVGSTPTARLSARGLVSESRPGIFVFGDRDCCELGTLDASDIALQIASTVVSTTGDRVVLDAGSKSAAREMTPMLDGPFAIAGFSEARFLAMYEHHAVFDVSACDRKLAVGDIVGLVPNHVCPVVNLATEMVIVDHGVVVSRWPIEARAKNS